MKAYPMFLRCGLCTRGKLTNEVPKSIVEKKQKTRQMKEILKRHFKIRMIIKNPVSFKKIKKNIS